MTEQAVEIARKVAVLLEGGWIWVTDYLSSKETFLQVCALMVALLFSKLLAAPLTEKLEKLSSGVEKRWVRWVAMRFEPVAYPLVALVLLAGAMLLFEHLPFEAGLLKIASNLIGVWVIIRLTSSFIEGRELGRWIAILAWSGAALNILGLLEPALRELEALGFTIGKTHVSALLVLKGVVAFALLIWGANLLAKAVERRIHGVTTLTPSLRVLIVKMLRVLLILLAVLIALNTLGIDLRSLAIFSGAVGVGVGFGLQKVVSNFIGGIILLLDRSIKPGDVIYIHDTDTYGWVNWLGARCVSVVTRDGKEHLIPNELMITDKVENWSYSNRDVRIRIPVGISYESDLRKALRLMEEVAIKSPRVLQHHPVSAQVMKFGENRVEMELRVWIDDPVNGVGNVTSALLLDIWDSFNRNGISFSYAQREVKIKEGSAIAVKIEQ